MIGCDLLEIDDKVIDFLWHVQTCSTAILGPELTIASPSFLVEAGHLITFKNGVEVLEGSRVMLFLSDP